MLTSQINDLKSVLELAIAIAFFGRLTWQISELKSNIYSAIDKVNDDTNYRMNQLEKRLEIHLNDYDRSTDLTTLICNQLKEAIEHKFKRLYSSMRDIEKYLQKSHSFRVREYFGDDSSRLNNE